MNLQTLIKQFDDNAQRYMIIENNEIINGEAIVGVRLSQGEAALPAFKRIEHADNRPGVLEEVVDNGVVLSVDKNTQISDLIHIVVVSDIIAKRRIQVSVEQFANVRFMFHEIANVDYTEFLSVYVMDEAKCDITIVDSNENNATLTLLREGTVEQNAALNWSMASLSSGNTTTENFTNLIGRGATSDSKLITVGTHEQKQLHRVQINNLAQNTDGNILNHGVMKNKARGEFYGVGFIEKGCDHSNAEQESRMMVIDKEARADVHPILLIDEYDVIAGHAGSVGKVSEEALYYLMSRGMSKAEAERLITKGFLSPVLESIEEASVREMIETLIERMI